MTGKTHDLAAVTVLGLVAYTIPPGDLNIPTVIAALFVNQIGGIFPDIDQPTAPFWRNLPIGSFFGKLVGVGLGGHRGISHSLVGFWLFGILSKTALTFLTPVLGRIDTGYVWWAFMIGYASHLIMDTFTKEGVPWLLPLPFKFGFPPVKHLRITTGKKFEVLLVFPVLVAFNVWFYSVHYGQLVTIIHSFQR